MVDRESNVLIFASSLHFFFFFLIIIIIITIIIIYSLEFFTSGLTDGFLLNDCKSPQVFWTLLSILAVLNNVVLWTVSTRPSTSNSSSPFSNPLVTVPNAPITIGIIATFIFHSVFNSLARSRYLCFFSHSFSFILWSAGTAKPTILHILFFFFFLLIIIRSGLPAEIRGCVCMSKSHRISPSDCLVWYPRHSCGEGWGLNLLQKSSRCILQLQPTR